MRRRITLIAAGALVLAACGSTPENSAEPAATNSESVATEAPPDSSATPDEAASASEPTSPAATTPPSVGGDVADTTPPVEAPNATEAPAATEATTAPTEPPAPALPDDGCSADNSPTPTDVAEGPVPSLEVRAESADSPLPDLAIRRINCAGGWVNLKNELPSALPLLVWFYAPH